MTYVQAIPYNYQSHHSKHIFAKIDPPLRFMRKSAAIWFNTSAKYYYTYNHVSKRLTRVPFNGHVDHNILSVLHIIGADY